VTGYYVTAVGPGGSPAEITFHRAGPVLYVAWHIRRPGPAKLCINGRAYRRRQRARKRRRQR
jgi:hypothetical protein